MFSSEDEYVEFLTQVDTASAQGNVDEWLLQVENSMIEAVKFTIEKGFEDYTKVKRSSWVLDRCGQSVLNMGMTFWTFETEAAIASGLKGVQKHLAFLNQSVIPPTPSHLQLTQSLPLHQIEDIVGLVR